MNRTWRIISWVFSTTIMFVALCFAAFAIWAISGPRDLSQYNGYVEKSVNERMNGKHIKIAKTELSWGAIDELMALSLNDVVLLDEKNVQVAKFPKVILRYSFGSLLTGHLIPSRIKLVRPNIDLNGLGFETNNKGDVYLSHLNIDQFDHVEIQDGKLVTPYGQAWNVKSANMHYAHNTVSIDADMGRVDTKETVKIFGRSNLSKTKVNVRMDVANYDTDDMKRYLPELAKAHLFLSGSFNYVQDKSRKQLSVDLATVKGEINDPELFDNKLEIKSGIVKGSYDFGTKHAQIDNFAAVFADGLKVGMKGSLTAMSAFDLEANLGGLKTDNIPKYWPKTVKLDAIDFIRTRMSGGEVTGAKAVVHITPEEMKAGKISKKSVNVQFAFKGVALEYSDKFVPVKEGAGSGVIDGDSLKVKFDSGVSGNTKLTSGIAEIVDISGPNEHLEVTANAQGEAGDMAEFYLKTGSGTKVVASKADISGVAVSEARVELPLLKDLKLDDVKYAVKSRIVNGAVRNFAGKFDLNAANFNLAADNNSYKIVGQAVAALSKPLDVFDLKNAPVNFDVSSSGPNMRIVVNSDITNSSITVAPLEVVKKAGEAGKMFAQIDAVSGQNPVITKAAISSDAIKLGLSGQLQRDYGDFVRLDVDKLEFGKTDLVGRVVKSPVLTAEFKAGTFDAQPALRYLKNRKDSGEDDSEYRVLLKSDNVILMNGQSLKNAEVSVHCARPGCDEIKLNASGVTIDQSGGALSVKVKEAGNLLNGLGLYENMKGGVLTVDAKVAGKVYDGKVTIDDFYVVNARVLAKMLTLGSLTGIADTVRGKGIWFKKLSADVKMDKHSLTIDNGRMAGPAIGITAKGAINRDSNVVSVEGNIIPAYTANTLLGKIPLIGKVVIGDDGVFAVAYSMKGNMDNPDISVNPLTVLAPGFLRRVFE